MKTTERLLSASKDIWEACHELQYRWHTRNAAAGYWFLPQLHR